MRCLVRAAFSLSLCLASTAARAEPAPRVAVVVAAEPAPRAELEAAIKVQHTLPVSLRLVELPNQPERRARDAAETALQEALREARQRYIDAEFEACLGKLPDAAQLTVLVARGDVVTPARALLWRVACEVGRAGGVEAAQAAAEFASLGLLLPPDVSAVAPDAERLLTDALHSAQAAARAALHIESKPTAREVWLDGRALGCVTPCTSQVIAGEHVVSLLGDGTRPLALRLRTEGRDQTLSLTPEPALPELARSQWSARYLRAADLDGVASLQLLAQALPARRLLLIKADAVAHGKFELRGAYINDGRLAARAGAAPTALPELRAESMRLIEELLVRGQTLAPPRPLWKNGWFWGAIGVVAIGAVTATALLLHKPSERTEVRFQ